jgi:hypothetical protein
METIVNKLSLLFLLNIVVKKLKNTLPKNYQMKTIVIIVCLPFPQINVVKKRITISYQPKYILGNLTLQITIHNCKKQSYLNTL